MNAPAYTQYNPECYSFADGEGQPYPALLTRGCGCCSVAVKVTRENLDEAIRSAREWVGFLESLSPVDYPPEIGESL